MKNFLTPETSFSFYQMNIARFYYADYFPKLHGQVIHLDSDIIVQGQCLLKHSDIPDEYTVKMNFG